MRIKELIKNVFSYKFVKDSSYTFVSQLILALSGIIANIIVGNAYNADGLGIFNQALALYLIVSLISIWGLQVAVVKYASENRNSFNILKEVFSTAIVIALLFSMIIASASRLLSIYFPAIFFNQEVTKATNIILLSLPLLSINKIIVSFTNGLRHIKTLSIIRSSRWIIIISFIIITIILKKELYFLFYGFLLTETILIIFLVIYYNKYFTLNLRKSTWFKKNLQFGSKSVFLQFMSQTNNKLDIFLVSIFLTNYHVGIYSFASTVVKGFLLVPNVIQTNINPIISELWSKKDIINIKSYTKRVSKIMIRITLLILVVAVIAYPILINLFMEASTYAESIPIFYILLAGIVLPAIYNFAGAYLSMSNHLNIAMRNLSLVILYSIISSIIFINLFGLYGASIATSTTYLFSVILLHYTVKYKMGIKLISFKRI